MSAPATSSRRPTRRWRRPAQRRRPTTSPPSRWPDVPVDVCRGRPAVDGPQVQLTFEGADIALGGRNQLASEWSSRATCRRAGDGDDPDGVRTGRPDGRGHVARGGADVGLTVALDGDTSRSPPMEPSSSSRTRVRRPRPPARGHDVERRGADHRGRRVIAARRWPGPTASSRTARYRRHRRATRVGELRARRRRLNVGPIATTRAACTDPAATEGEQIVLATLTGTSTYEIVADALTLQTGADGLMLRAPADHAGATGLEGITWTLDSIVENMADANTVTAVPASIGRHVELRGGDGDRRLRGATRVGQLRGDGRRDHVRTGRSRP